jgi:hypothetical protein
MPRTLLRGIFILISCSVHIFLKNCLKKSFSFIFTVYIDDIQPGLGRGINPGKPCLKRLNNPPSVLISI